MIEPEFFRDKKCLITGGLGFIGSNLARMLLEMGAHFTLVDSLIPEYGGNLFNVDGIEPGLRINISDVRERFSMRALLKDQDYLFNLAGQTSHLDSMHNPYADIEINCHAQISILEACRHHNPDLKSSLPRRAKFMANPIICRSMKSMSRVPSMSTASTKWRANGITFSITTFTGFAPVRYV